MIKKLFIILAAVLVLTSCRGKGDKREMEKYFFEYNGVRFSVGDGADEITDKLGEWNSMSRAASCAGVGEDIIYIYNGFRILACSRGDAARITAIELTSDAVSTPEGVGLGDCADAVIKTYGVPETRDGNIIEYESGGVRLRFLLSKGSVRSVKYLPCDG